MTKARGEIACACAYTGKNKTTQKPTWRENKDSKSYRASFNLGPKSYSPILLQNRKSLKKEEASGERILMAMQWGMIPSWHKGDPKKFSFNMINCRSDSIQEKKSFSKALQKGQRCVVLCEGFYEWHGESKDTKQPYYVRFKDTAKPHQQKEGVEGKQLLTMAGLFDRQLSEESGELYTYSIITVDASSSMKWLHHRMPAILETPESVQKWLDVDDVPADLALDLLKSTDCLEWYPVSNTVNNVRNDSEDCTKKIDLVKEKAKKARSGKLMANWLKKAEKRNTEEENVEQIKKKIKMDD